MAKFKVLDIRKVPSGQADRAGRMDHLVTFQLDPLRTYFTAISKDTIDDKDIIEAVKAELEGMQRFTGKEFEL